MAIELVQEDGTIVDDANTYVTLDAFRAYALKRGKTLSDDDDTVAAQLIRAADYIELYAPEFVGTKADLLQALCWPRAGVSSPLEAVFLPVEVIRAQCEIGLAVAAGLDPMPVRSAGARVTKRKIGELEFDYDLSDDTIRIPLADRLLETYMRTTATLTTVRI
jgi:hypothetical protein